MNFLKFEKIAFHTMARVRRILYFLRFNEFEVARAYFVNKALGYSVVANGDPLGLTDVCSGAHGAYDLLKNLIDHLRLLPAALKQALDL